MSVAFEQKVTLVPTHDGFTYELCNGRCACAFSGLAANPIENAIGGARHTMALAMVGGPPEIPRSSGHARVQGGEHQRRKPATHERLHGQRVPTHTEHRNPGHAVAYVYIETVAPLGSVTASEILRQAWPRQAGWLPAANRQSHRPAQGKGPEAHLFHVIELSNTMTRLSLLTDPVTAAKPSRR